MRLLVCGSRDWGDKEIIHTVLEGFAARHDLKRVIAGGAPGADTLAFDWAYEKDIHWVFPADWKKYGKAAGPRRNQQMLDQGKPDMVLAFKDGFDYKWAWGVESASGHGTEDMVLRAKNAGVPVYVIERA